MQPKEVAESGPRDAERAMVEKMFTTKAAGKFLTWIFGKDSTAIATWATIGLGWAFYEYVYKPERAEERKTQVLVAAENAKAMAEMRAMADARDKTCSQDKSQLYEMNKGLMQRIDRMLGQSRRPAADASGVATASPEFDCDP